MKVKHIAACCCLANASMVSTAYKRENAQVKPVANHAWSSCAVNSPPSDADLLDALESCFFGTSQTTCRFSHN